MKLFLTLACILTILSNSIAQSSSREQKITQIKKLQTEISKINDEIDKIAVEVLLVDPLDLKEAEYLGVSAFRLMPREVYGRQIRVPQEGGSVYSFTTRSHEYQKIAQINLERDRLSSGFAGVNFGLMADIGNFSLVDDLSGVPEVGFLTKYKAPTNVIDARAEQTKSREYKVDNIILRSHSPAVVGHTYVLRAISYDGGNADVLVALKVIRKDTDGSLIIYWKQLADFGKPALDPNIREK